MSTLHYPPSIDWELTFACNHNCVHCYNYWRKQDSNRIYGKNRDYYIECAERIIQSNPVSVQITGGEPLAVWNLSKDAIQMLLEAGIYVSINTNATLVTDEIAQFLGENKIDAFVSFPCCRAEIFDYIVNSKGAFFRAIAGIQKLIDYGVRISLNMVVTRINLPYVYETAKYIHDTFNLPYFSATKASFPQNADSEFRSQMLNCIEFNKMLGEMLRVKRDFSMRVDSAWVYSLCGFTCEDVREQFGFNRKCGCGKYSFVIDPDGNMKACGCDSTSYGNILQDPFSVGISKMTIWHDGSLLAPECKTCTALKYCGGGCRADSYSSHGYYCTMDSTADPKRRNCVISAIGRVARYDKGMLLMRNPEAKILQENGFTRISYRSNYEFISNQASEFLTKRDKFSVWQLLEVSTEPVDEVYNWIDKLIRKKLLYLCTLSKNEKLVQVFVPKFELSASPYIPENASQFICDYAGANYNSKRFI